MPLLTNTMTPEREALERRGIFYVDCLGQSSDSANHGVSTRIHEYLGIEKPRSQTGRAPIPVPDHVDQLREILHDIRGVIPRHGLDALHASERVSIPREAIAADDDNHHSSQERAAAQQRFRAIVQECSSVARKAEKLRRERTSKHEWLRFMEDHILRKLVEKEPLSFSSSGGDDLLDAYEPARQGSWKCNAMPGQIGNLTTTSTITLGYPIQVYSRPRHGLEKIPLNDNFTAVNLRGLLPHGLTIRPMTTPEDVSGSKKQHALRNDGNWCFPFATIDYDTTSDLSLGQDQISCRAATAASKSLSMLENLYRFADMTHPDFHIPSVVAFTTSGPIVRIWTAFSLPCRDGRAAHIVTCIKQSEMTSTWAVLEMHAIISNLLRWATRVHKPKISTQLDRWRTVLSRPPPQLPAQAGEQIPVSPIGPLPTAAIKNHNRVNSLQNIELMALVRKLEDDKSELEKANRELQERNAELASFLKQATGEIREALCYPQRSDSAMATEHEDERWQCAAGLRTM